MQSCRLPFYLVNKYVSRKTFMLAANRLTQISNERKPATGRLFVACPPSPDTCLSVSLTLDCVQFSKTDCASVRFNVDNGNKTSPWFVCISVGLLLPYIPNWDGLSRQMSEPKWTKSKLRQTFQRLSRATEG